MDWRIWMAGSGFVIQFTQQARSENFVNRRCAYSVRSPGQIGPQAFQSALLIKQYNRSVLNNLTCTRIYGLGTRPIRRCEPEFKLAAVREEGADRPDAAIVLNSVADSSAKAV